MSSEYGDNTILRAQKRSRYLKSMACNGVNNEGRTQDRQDNMHKPFLSSPIQNCNKSLSWGRPWWKSSGIQSIWIYVAS